MPTRKWSEIEAQMTPEQIERSDALADKMLKEYDAQRLDEQETWRNKVKGEG